MGRSHMRKPKIVESSPDGLRNETNTSLLTTGVPRICSHQHVDDHRKKREPHNITHNK